MMDDQMDRTIDQAAAEYNRPPEAPREEMWRTIEARRAATATPAIAPDVRIIAFRRRATRFAVPVGVAALLALAFGLGRFSADDTGSSSAPIAIEQPASGPSGAPDSGAIDQAADPAELATAPSDLSDPTGTLEAPVSDSPTRRAAERSVGQTFEAPSRQTAELPSRRAAESPSRQAAQPPSRQATDALALAAREHLAQAESFLVLFRASLNAGQQVEPVVPATARYLLASNRLLIDSPAANDPGMRRLLSDVELVLAQIAQMPAEGADSTDEQLITDGIEQRDLLLRIRTAAGTARGMPNQGVL